MRYQKVQKGIFLSRPNRFIAHVAIDGVDTVVHVKNTGRCRELLTPGAVVYLDKSDNSHRKTAYDLIAVEKGKKLINMDAQAPNRVFAEFARQYEPDAAAVRSEVVYGSSRLDFCLETPAGLHFVEVKGVTLEENGHVSFPDAPTERGIKHLQELQRAVQEGHRATIFFVVQMGDVVDFTPNDANHAAFGAELRRAVQNGVAVAAYDCVVQPDSLRIGKPVKVCL